MHYHDTTLFYALQPFGFRGFYYILNTSKNGLLLLSVGTVRWVEYLHRNVLFIDFRWVRKTPGFSILFMLLSSVCQPWNCFQLGVGRWKNTICIIPMRNQSQSPKEKKNLNTSCAACRKHTHTHCEAAHSSLRESLGLLLTGNREQSVRCAFGWYTNPPLVVHQPQPYYQLVTNCTWRVKNDRTAASSFVVYVWVQVLWLKWLVGLHCKKVLFKRWNVDLALHCRLEEEQQRRRSPEADIEQLMESLVLQN